MNSRSLTRAGADEIEEPRVVGRREAVAERPRDRHAEPRRRRADAQIAGERDRAAAAGRDAVRPARWSRHRDALEPVDDARPAAARRRWRPRAVENPVNWLMSVPATNALPRAAQHEHADGSVGVHAIARVDQRFVHLPGHRVSGFGTVERQKRERTFDVEQCGRSMLDTLEWLHS